jgi:hypothetical protein
MTEAEAIARLAASRLLAEVVVNPYGGYVIFDQLDRPLEMLGRPEFPDVMTYIWQEAEEWIWEFHHVVPGPGPKRRYRSLRALVDDVLREYQACRRMCQAEQAEATPSATAPARKSGSR